MSLSFLTAPCGCIVDCPTKMILLWQPSKKHMAQHKEYDAGIIHDCKCRIVMIPVTKLVLNEDLLKNLEVK